MDVNRLKKYSESDGGSVPSAFTGKHRTFLDENEKDIRSFSGEHDFIDWARSVEHKYGEGARFVTVKCHDHVLLFKREWEKSKIIPRKTMVFPFALVSEQVRKHAEGRHFFRWLHHHKAGQFTFITSEKNVKEFVRGSAEGCPKRKLAHYYNSALHAINGRHPASGSDEAYRYAFDGQLFKAGNLWTLSYFWEETFVARWEPAIAGGHASREEMLQKLSRLVEAKAPHDFYLDWRHFLVDDAHYVLDGYREIFWAAAHAINKKNILTGGEETYIRRFEDENV